MPMVISSASTPPTMNSATCGASWERAAGTPWADPAAAVAEPGRTAAGCRTAAGRSAAGSQAAGTGLGWLVPTFEGRRDVAHVALRQSFV